MGNSDAFGLLAKLYYQGTGVAQDYTKAIEWYKKTPHNPKVKIRLGEMYLEGKGVEQDYQEAAHYFYWASTLGDKTIAPKYLKEIEKLTNKKYKEQNAMFPGGEETFSKWIHENLKYPKDCLDKGITGHVNTQFVIDVDGSIVDVEVLSSSHPSLAKETIRFVNSMPQWEPQIHGDKPIRSILYFPFIFRQNNTGKAECYISGWQ